MSKESPEKQTQDAIKYFVWCVGLGIAIIIYMHSNFLSISVANERMAQRKDDFKELNDKVDKITRQNNAYFLWSVQNWGKKNPAPFPGDLR
jgi:uncharacterized membrane protein (DUF106 family)